MAIRLSPEDIRQLGLKGIRVKPRSKYRAVRTVYNGVSYASKAEAERAKKLDIDQAFGLVFWWIAQPTFRLGCPENIYRPDFLVVHHPGVNAPEGVHAEDVKGYKTPKFKRDVKLWVKYGPCPLWIIGDGVTDVVEGRIDATA